MSDICLEWVEKTEGDFIITFSFADIPPLESNIIAFDLYRMTDNGKVDEHWDVIQSVNVDSLDKILF